MDSGNRGQGGNHPLINQQQGGAPPAEHQPSSHLQLALIEMGPKEIAALKTPDRGKRDEWSEGGVLSLLEAYESKWLIRNRAKLKGSDWEDIAHQVSDRSGGTKALKTPNQCKNKIESMKKRYRAESSGSSWQFYTRMDNLLKGTFGSQAKDDNPTCANGGEELVPQDLPKIEPDNSQHALKWASDAGKTQICDAADVEAEVHMQDSNRDDGSNTLPDNRKESRGTGSDISTPKSKIPNAGDAPRKHPFKRKKSLSSDVAESIRMLASSILKVEQARMEMYKESERLRVEAEIKRSEMELKRTEIIAQTQLQIAKLLSRRLVSRNDRGGSSSLRTEATISPTVPKNADGRRG